MDISNKCPHRKSTYSSYEFLLQRIKTSEDVCTLIPDPATSASKPHNKYIRIAPEDSAHMVPILVITSSVKVFQ